MAKTNDGSSLLNRLGQQLNDNVDQQSKNDNIGSTASRLLQQQQQERGRDQGEQQQQRDTKQTQGSNQRYEQVQRQPDITLDKQPESGRARGQPLTGARQQQILDQHNSNRSRYNVAPLVWSDSLAQQAAAYAGNCKFAHSGASGQGENLAMTTLGTIDASGWIAEERLFKCGGVIDDGFHSYGHWTQLMWPGTTAVGCGSASCSGGEILVCRYTPPGNVSGVAPFTQAQCQAAGAGGGSGAAQPKKVFQTGVVPPTGKVVTGTDFDTGGPPLVVTKLPPAPPETAPPRQPLFTTTGRQPERTPQQEPEDETPSTSDTTNLRPLLPDTRGPIIKGPSTTETTTTTGAAPPPSGTAPPPSGAAPPPSGAAPPPSGAAPPSTVAAPPPSAAVPPSTAAPPPSAGAVPPLQQEGQKQKGEQDAATLKAIRDAAEAKAKAEKASAEAAATAKAAADIAEKAAAKAAAIAAVADTGKRIETAKEDEKKAIEKVAVVVKQKEQTNQKLSEAEQTLSSLQKADTDAKTALTTALKQEQALTDRRGDPQALQKAQLERAQAEQTQYEVTRNLAAAEKALAQIKADAAAIASQELAARQQADASEAQIAQLEQLLGKQQQDVSAMQAAPEPVAVEAEQKKQSVAAPGAKTNGLAIGLAIAGGILLIGAIIFLVWFFMKRGRSQRAKSAIEKESAPTYTEQAEPTASNTATTSESAVESTVTF